MLVWSWTEYEESRILTEYHIWKTRLRDKPRKKWPDEVREDGTIDIGEGWKARVCNREEWKKHLRTAKNRRNLHMSMNESGYPCRVSNDVAKLRNATVRLIMPIHLSVCPSAMNNLSRNVCGFFEILTWILIYPCSLITIASALHQTALHLRCQLAECLL